MQAKIAEWVHYLRLTVSAETAKQYEYHLRELDKSAPDRRPDEWTTDRLIAHIAGRRAAGVGEAMTKQVVGAFRNFFAYACPGASPARAVPYPKVHRRKQRTLDAETALKVLAACDTTTHIGTRDLALLSLMLDSGLRASEVCRLRLPKIDFEKRRFTVVVKGGDEDVGVFSRTTAAHIARWLSVRPEHAAPEVDTLFVSMGGYYPGRSLTRDGLRGIFRVIAERAGLAAFSPHDLRRTFATIAIRNGAPTRVVQAAGRWGDLGLVERYTQDIQAEDFERYSPVESLLRGRE